MKVLHLTTNAEARFFAEQNRALADRGVEQTVVEVPGDQYETQSNDGTRSLLHYLGFYPRVLRRSFGEYDLLHANCGMTGPVAVTQPNLPVVMSLWGSDLMGSYGWVSEFSANFCEEVVVMTREMARVLDRDCEVVPHGVDTDRFRPLSGERARTEVGWRPDALHVLFPYSPRRAEKNYPRAERVVDRVRGAFDRDVELHHLSGVAHERMPYYYNAADALLLPSRREGSPNSVKEALACNLPVVATDVGDVRDRLDGVGHSYVCHSDDELARGLRRALPREVRSDGREKVDEVRLDAMADRLLAVYERALGRRERPADERGRTADRVVRR